MATERTLTEEENEFVREWASTLPHVIARKHVDKFLGGVAEWSRRRRYATPIITEKARKRPT